MTIQSWTGQSWAGFDLRQPLVMGIVNVTPDSFSDGGEHATPEAAIAHGRLLARQGADILDIGGETTRPGAQPPDLQTELARVLPVIEALAGDGLVLSIDTRRAAVMEAAIRAGARIVNDVSGLAHDPEARGTVARLGCPVVLMHMRGTPATMTEAAQYGDVIEEVKAELAALIIAAAYAGVAPDRIAIDPGIGFAKTAEQSLDLLARVDRFTSLGYPLLIGASRKSFIGHLRGEADPKARIGGSIAAALFAAQNGARILRVHDVLATRQALDLWQAVTARAMDAP